MHLALQVFAASQTLEKTAVRLFRPHGLTPAQFNVLNLLSDQPGGLRASALAEALIVDRSNVTGLIRRMKRDELIAELESTDRRQRIVGLTDKGRRRWKTAHHDYERCLAAIDEALAPPLRVSTAKALRLLTDVAAAR